MASGHQRGWIISTLITGTKQTGWTTKNEKADHQALSKPGCINQRNFSGMCHPRDTVERTLVKTLANSSKTGLKITHSEISPDSSSVGLPYLDLMEKVWLQF